MQLAKRQRQGDWKDATRAQRGPSCALRRVLVSSDRTAARDKQYNHIARSYRSVSYWTFSVHLVYCRDEQSNSVFSPFHSHVPSVVGRKRLC